MKILFLHLSDAHIKDDTDVNRLGLRALSNSLVQMGEFDECVLVFSGDLALSGTENEYNKVGEFVGKLIALIKNKYFVGKKTIKTLFVPGNHDLIVKNPYRSNEEVEGFYKKRLIEKMHCEELKQQEHFLRYARRNHCFLENNIIDVRLLEFNGFAIRVNLINSAPFSLLGSGNQDKGLHYLPDDVWGKLRTNYDENYTISIIHHGPEWFYGKAKEKLYEDMYSTSNLIFVGHEHFSQSESKKVNDEYRLNISSGIALYGTNTEHGFNALILDTQQRTLNGKKFVFNGVIYRPISNISDNNVIFKGINNFTFTEKFYNDLSSDGNDREGELYEKYFVFPAMEVKDINDDFKDCVVNNEKKFLEFLNLKKRISIEGGSKAGKTILAKYLCRILIENYVPILLMPNNFALKDNEKMLKYAFQHQFGENADYDSFLQMDGDKKVLIIDDSDKIKKESLERFVFDISKKFQYVILLTNIEWNLNIKEKAVEQLSENKFFYMNLNPFYYEKRKELIRKICSVGNDSRIINIEDKVHTINESITNQIKYFQLTPDFIHQYVDYFLNFSFVKTAKESNVFSKVYEANIVYRIAKYTSEENVDEIMLALDHVAQHVHFNKKYPLSFNNFKEVIHMCNEKYDNEIKAKYVYDVAVKARVIRDVSGDLDIEFCDENLLAYFTAIHLNRKFNEGNGAEELMYVLENVCFGINGDIILFLSYITSNIQILSPIVNSIIAHMGEWEELNLDSKNIDYLGDIKFQIESKMPGVKEKQEMVEQKTEMEKEIVKSKNSDAESLYSYDESKVNSFENKLKKSARYLELMSKILPNFRHMLQGEDKKTIVELIYQYPNKLLYFILKDINENYEKIINDILSKVPQIRRGKLITRDIITKELQNQSMTYILSIYDFIASTTTNGKTILDLNKFEVEKNTNYRLQNIMMEENIGRFNEFIHKAEKLYDDAKLEVTKQMVKLVVRKYFICHNVNVVGETQRIVDKFFEKGEKKNITMLQAKNRVVKK